MAPLKTLFPLIFALVPAPAQVLTSQNDNLRTSANLRETILTPQNVNSARFGKLSALHVDGDVYAQPLYVPGVEIPGKGRHNVVFVATEHDSVYAFDADGRTPVPLWQVSFLSAKAGVTTVPSSDVFCPFIQPEIGITPNPVIDAASGTLYVSARTHEDPGFFKSYRHVQRLHALTITTGQEKFGGPVAIEAPAFDPLLELPRAGLLLSGGQVYLTWASSCDVRPYHGWVMMPTRSRGQPCSIHLQAQVKAASGRPIRLLPQTRKATFTSPPETAISLPESITATRF